MNYSITEIKQINKEKSPAYWFGKAEMKFFNSKIESGVYCGRGGIYFTTSERMETHMNKRYTVRCFDPESGSVDTVGEFQQYSSNEEAKDMAKTCSINKGGNDE